MDEAEFELWLREAIEANFEVKRIQTFERAGFRFNYGLVVSMEDGTEFQVTIVQSK